MYKFNNKHAPQLGFSCVLGTKLNQLSDELDQKLTSKASDRKYNRIIHKRVGLLKQNKPLQSKPELSHNSKALLEYEIKKLTDLVCQNEQKNIGTFTLESQALIKKIEQRIIADAIDCDNLEDCEKVFEKSLSLFKQLMNIYTQPEDSTRCCKNVYDNTAFLLRKNCDIYADCGMCVGFTTSFVNAVLSNDLVTFANRLKLLSRDSNNGWIFFGYHWHSLEFIFGEAYHDYKSYIKEFSSPFLSHNEIYEQYGKFSPDSMQLMELRAWLDLMTLSMFPEKTSLNGCMPHQNFGKQFEFVASQTLMANCAEKNSQRQPLFFTEYWPIIVSKDSAVILLQSLSDGIYIFSTTGHIFAVKITNDYLLFFNTLLPSFFLAIHKQSLQDNKAIVFNNFDVNREIKSCYTCSKDGEDNSELQYKFTDIFSIPENSDSISACIFATSTNAKIAEDLNTQLKKVAFDSYKFIENHNNEQSYSNYYYGHVLYYALTECNLCVVRHLLKNANLIEYIKKTPGKFTFLAATKQNCKAVNELLNAGDSPIYRSPNSHNIFIINNTTKGQISIGILNIDITIDF